jgi:exodeoxyribonuclease V beta subunit
VCKWPLTGYGELPQGFTEQHLYQWLQQVLETPLPKSDCLASIPLSKTLRESEFYFPMEKARSGQLAKLLTDHRNCAPVINSANNTRNNLVKLPSYQTLTGMMHGFVDLIFQDQGKYYVCDYKSSHLGNDFDDYHHDALLINVEKNYYDLQYLIYCLALHRHLKHSLADYDIEQHFGGIYYFYLRGMAGNVSETNTYNGVYYRKITAAELIQLDDIFSGAIS